MYQKQHLHVFWSQSQNAFSLSLSLLQPHTDCLFEMRWEKKMRLKKITRVSRTAKSWQTEILLLMNIIQTVSFKEARNYFPSRVECEAFTRDIENVLLTWTSWFSYWGQSLEGKKTSVCQRERERESLKQCFSLRHDDCFVGTIFRGQRNDNSLNSLMMMPDWEGSGLFLLLCWEEKLVIPLEMNQRSDGVRGGYFVSGKKMSSRIVIRE